MKNLFISFFIMSSFFCAAQEYTSIQTENENEKWFNSLKETIEILDRINMINNRLENDVNIFINRAFPDGIKTKNIPKLDSLMESRKKGFCKPLFILKYNSKELIFKFENPINSEKTNSVINLINTDNIKEIDVWIDERKLIYGTIANCGIIFIEISKHKIFQAFEELNLTNNYIDEIMNY